jgi:dTDP-4-amino-4,6-dideoxygalactose transaminase
MARDRFIPFAPPLIGEEEIAEVADTLRSGWITTGPKTQRFEEAFAHRLGAPAALALNSCTASMHLALVCLGIGPGDEVITTPLTFCATVNVIEHVGARPVLVDVEPDTLNIDPARIEAAITPRTKAILPVHYAGHPVDLDPIQELAEAHGLQILEDAAHSVRAAYKGRRIGSGSNPVAFSFYATKNLTTGEGGMLTGSVELVDHARTLALHGMSRDAWRRYEKDGTSGYDVVAPGFKYNMTDIQASLGLCQLARLDSMQGRRCEIVAAYQHAFAEIDALELPVEHTDVEHAWHLYVLRLRHGALAIDRGAFTRELAARNIGTSVHFIPIHLHRYYKDKYGYAPGDFPIAFDNYERMLSLPLSPKMTDQDVADVIEAVGDVVARHRA